MLTLICEIEGETESDVLAGLAEIRKQVERGMTRGQDGGEGGSYTFDLTGVPRDEEDTV